MIYNINFNSLRNSICNLGNFLSLHGYKIPTFILLEAFSRSLFFNNWKHLEASMTDPKIIDFYTDFCKYCVQIKTNCDENMIKVLLDEAILESGNTLMVDNFTKEKSVYSFEINLIKEDCERIDISPVMGKLYRKIEGDFSEIILFEYYKIMQKKYDCVESFKGNLVQLN